MTDYVKNLTSDKPWLRSEAERLATQLAPQPDNAHSYIEWNGVLRWKSNDRVPPADIVELAAHLLGQAVNVANSTRARDKETTEFLAEYRRNYKGPTAEERAEARAAHGPGVELVNVITGHRWRT
jgi:hypothetical protein